MYDAADIFRLVDEMAPAMGVDPVAAKTVIAAEHVHKDRASGGWKLPAQFSPRPSPVGAEGVGQVMPKTRAALVAQGYLPKDLANDTSLRGQVAASLAAVKEMQKRAGNDPLRLAAYYNGGTKAGQAYGTSAFAQAPAETQTHVEKARYAMDQIKPSYDAVEMQKLVRQPNSPVTSTATPAASNPMSMMLRQIQQAFGNVSEATNESVNALTGYQAAADAGMESAKQAVLDQASGATMAASGSVRAAEIQQERKDFLTRQFLLTDSDVQANRDQYAMFESQRLQLEDQINSQLAVGFFDNPLQHIMNLTTLPGLVQQHNGLARKVQTLDKQISQRQTHSANQQQVTAASQLEAIKLQEQGKAMETSAKAAADLARLEVENADTDAKNTLQILSAEAGRMEAGARLMQITRQELAEQKAFQEKTTEAQEQAVEVASINKLLAPIGGSIDERSWKEMTATSKLPMRQMLARGNYGNSLAEAYDVITGSGLYNRSRAAPSVVVTIDLIGNQLGAKIREAEAKDTLKKGKPADYRAQAMAALETEWAETAKKGTDRERLPMGNPHMLDFNALHLSGQWKDSWIGKVMTQRAQGNMVGGAVGLKFDDFATEALAQIAAKKTTPAKAAEDLSRFYATADDINYEQRGLAIFHVPKPQAYTVFAGPAQRAVDAKNAADVRNFLELRSKAQVQQQLQFQLLQQNVPSQLYMPGAPPEMIMGPRGPEPRPMRQN
jgi:hypothetical protein